MGSAATFVSRGIARIAACVLLLGSAALTGCGGLGGGSISGKVTHQGEPVKGGSLTFSPAADGKNPGKPVGAEINADGTYSAPSPPAGKNKVIYSAPVSESAELKPGQSPPPSPYDGLVPKQQEVDLKSGSSTLDIELVKPG
jgi:hypothetical protein